MKHLIPVTVRNAVLFTVALAVMAIAVFVAYRLLPEYSPIARTETYLSENDCLECHPLDKLSHKRLGDTAHPDYTIAPRDMEAYFAAIRLDLTFDNRQGNPDNALRQGERLARKYHCFICHGLYGQGGYGNRGAFKGYIPGWFGRDFDILTDNGDPAAIREWIRTGLYSKVVEEPLLGPFARYYIERQDINMPHFMTMPEADISILVEYVRTIRAYGAMDLESVLEYERASAD